MAQTLSEKIVGAVGTGNEPAIFNPETFFDSQTQAATMFWQEIR